MKPPHCLLLRQQAVDRSLRTIDATCPLVTKVHSEARRFAKDEYEILLRVAAANDEAVREIVPRRGSSG